jgi:hypothetical protein
MNTSDNSKTKKKKKTDEDFQKDVATKKKSSGLDEIDSLFSAKKRAKEEVKKEKVQKKKRRTDLPSRKPPTQSVSGWTDDGLGGRYNSEGYTGRKEEGGSRIFKAHLFNKPGFGQSKACPFDCDCCFI